MKCADKRRYRDKVNALIALAKIQHDNDADHQEQRAYRCPYCRGWHLTSQPLRRKAS